MNRLIEALMGTAWAMEERAFETMLENFVRLAGGERLALFGGGAFGPAYRVIDGVAVIPISGVLVKSVAGLTAEENAGLVATEQIQAALSNALLDSSVHGMVLQIDSPGGSIDGIAELGDAIFAARKKKPIYGFAYGMMASAGYWLGSQTEKIYGGKTAAIGSIGVYTVMNDLTNLAAKIGIKVHVIKAGELKAAGLPGTEVTAAQLADRQRIVNSIYDLFITAVGAGRNLSDAQVRALGNGSVMIGADALKAGLIDGVASLEEVIQKLKPAAKASGSPRAAETAKSPTGAKVMSEDEIRAAEKKRAADLKAAFPKDLAFAFEAIEQGWTVEQAKAQHHDKLEAELAAKDAKHAEELEKAKTAGKPAGLKPVGEGQQKPGGNAGNGSARAQFAAAVREKCKELGCDQAQAASKVADENPGLHRQMVEEANAGKPELVAAHFG